MTNIPEKIYLQIQGGEPDDDFKELSGVSWSVDKINANDIEYTLSLAELSGQRGKLCKHTNMDGNYCMDCGYDKTGNYH